MFTGQTWYYFVRIVTLKHSYVKLVQSAPQLEAVKGVNVSRSLAKTLQSTREKNLFLLQRFCYFKE